ncbi:MAG: bifunctional demethylmenaquinone methyltransferase/2-methoxy-6-polyprenyl-1,4-benzoquinol methylase UbiE [Armatimonadetes bacterium]|nr:bifunctional demethylmenaquinone methyltransferase/2-methoxy-6-polyprenyl-1,4-benzoquinol methylase UbiE [Armatimonadota bacterium]
MTEVPRLPPQEKARYVQRLFTAVAPTYDLLNTVLSFGLHKWWRKVATDECRLNPGDRGLDVAAGTGDFVLEMLRRVGPTGYVAGADFCMPMLKIGVKKLKGRADLLQGDALALPFPDDAFHATTMGFALRNVGDIQQTLNEMTRVVQPGGRVVQLELSRPTHPLFRPFYYFYFQRLLPFVGRMIHGKQENYAYLPASLKEFPPREEIAAMMRKAGLTDVIVKDLTFGIVAIYAGTKVSRLQAEDSRQKPLNLDSPSPAPDAGGDS